MARITSGAAALLLGTAGLVQAGGLDRTLTPVGVLFEEGDYVELSYGFTSPDVSGSVAGGLVGSGNVGVDYSQFAGSLKYDVSERISVALIVDSPFGAEVDYDETDPGYPFAGSAADFRSTGIALLGRYRFNDSFSLHAGARRVTTSADLRVDAPAAPGVIANYEAEYAEDSDTSYIVGAAYERPAIALRVALTYQTETEFSNDVAYRTGFNGALGPVTAGTVEYTLPQSLTLDFRTGIAAGTLLFGSVRWADWSETLIESPVFFGNPVVGYEDDVYTYTLGVGRRLTDQVSAAASLTYDTEASSDPVAGDPTSGASNLAPYDGQFGAQLAGTYAAGNGVEISGGVRYTWLGEAETVGIAAEFADNSAVSVGLRVGYRF